jgi:hypothetical protein
MAKTRLLAKAILFAFLAGGVVYGVVLAATSATLRKYQVDFVEVTGVGDSRVWTYAITANGDEDAALDQWTLSIDNSCGYKIFPRSSTPGVRSYATLGSYILTEGPNAGSDVCDGTPYTCAIANYEIVSNVIDPITNLRSITFKNADSPLSAANPVTQIFQVEVRNITEFRLGDTPVSATAGGTGESGFITGAVCPPTAVQLVHLKASSSPVTFTIVLIVAVSLAGLGLTGAIIRRKKPVE